jgi:hypothetical protein
VPGAGLNEVVQVVQLGQLADVEAKHVSHAASNKKCPRITGGKALGSRLWW